MARLRHDLAALGGLVLCRQLLAWGRSRGGYCWPPLPMSCPAYAFAQLTQASTRSGQTNYDLQGCFVRFASKSNSTDTLLI